MLSLTAAQQKAFDFIAGYIAAHGRSPSYDEITFGLGLSSKSRIGEILTALVERGWLQRLPGRARALRVISQVPTAADVRRLSDADLATLEQTVVTVRYERGIKAAVGAVR